MGQAVRFQETLRKLTMIDEGFIEGQVGLGLGLAAAPALDPKTAALLRLGGVDGDRIPRGLPGMVRWPDTGRGRDRGRDRRRAGGHRLVAGLDRVIAAAPDVATALGYDIAAALEGLDDG